MTNVDQNLTAMINRIQRSFNSDTSENTKWMLLQELKTLLTNKNCDQLNSVSYCAVLNKMLDALTVPLFEKKWQEELFDEVVLLGVPHDSFLVLVQNLVASNPSYQQKKILNLLEMFIKKGKMQVMFMDQCYFSDPMKIKLFAASGLWDELVTCIVSLPDRIANKTKGNVKKIFMPSHYVSVIRSTIFKALTEIHSILINNKDCSVEFLGKVTARLCNTGHGLTIVKDLTMQLIHVCSRDFVWRRISQNFVSKLLPSGLEMFMVHFLMCIPWYGYVDWLLGDVVLSHAKLKYLMTVKFLFIRQFKENIIQQNIIGYLACSDSRAALFLKVFESLLDCWADDKALKYQNFSQQYYLASSLMICCGHLKNKEITSKKRVLLQQALDGATIRIGSPDLSIRHLGMIVGESVSSVLDPSAVKLNFEQEFSSDLIRLKELLILPLQPDLNLYDNQFEMTNITFLEEENIDAKKGIASALNEKPDSVGDDDLKPYDLSNDISHDVEKPFYIRDCLEGLVKSEKPEWVEQCLRSAEGLIRSNPGNVKEVAGEMAKILLHLDNQTSMADFTSYRHKAMTALTVHCPKQVAPYLASQFYERDFNIRQRLDILEVLAAASQELSQPKCKVKKIEPQVSPSSIDRCAAETWREIVEKRLETKTRRFSQGPRKPLLEPELNMFGSVAGHFFFPLMEKFDKGNRALDLLTEDTYVLGRLLYTLGIIMHSATNTLVVKVMGSALLKFISAVKNNNEAFVRQACIFAAIAVFISVPSYVLLSELQEDLLSVRIWLEDTYFKDLDIDCQMQAVKALQILMNIAKEELPSLLGVVAND